MNDKLKYHKEGCETVSQFDADIKRIMDEHVWLLEQLAK